MICMACNQPIVFPVRCYTCDQVYCKLDCYLGHLREEHLSTPKDGGIPVMTVDRFSQVTTRDTTRDSDVPPADSGEPSPVASDKQSKRPILYLSGPMHGSKKWPDDRMFASDIARLAAKRLWLIGYAVFTPHGNTDFMFESGLYSDPFLDFDIQFIKQMADCIYMLPGWERSDGCAKELVAARTKGIMTLYSLQEAREWLHHG